VWRPAPFIEAGDNEKFVSIASFWEMAIKLSLGRLAVAQPFDVMMRAQLEQNGFALLPVTLPHLATVSTLPFHHRDPFDRLLIAQAKVEQLHVVTADPAFDAYAVGRLW
jgi:PIN domain nuclease of toxin-antitoxin system